MKQIVTYKHTPIHYLMEGFGLGIFMMSACFFGGHLEAADGFFHTISKSPFLRLVLMGVLMGGTALVIFFSPYTTASGAYINPAVTLAFWRLGQIGWKDSLFYIVCQFTGGTLSVYLMSLLMGDILSQAPVNYVITIPGKYGVTPAIIAEFLMSFIMMGMVLFTSASHLFKKYTRYLAAVLICIYVIIGGPVSGFGINPARSFSSALIAGNWNHIWIYIIIPIVGMLSAAELFLWTQKNK